MDIDLTKHIKNSQANLYTYLDALTESATKTQVSLSSRWPWKGRVVACYPTSFGQRLVLFFRTLRFDFLHQAQTQTLKHTINSFQIYKQAVRYEILASLPSRLYREDQLLSRLSNWLKQEHKLTRTGSDQDLDNQKELFFEWKARLEDFSSPIPSDLLLKILNSRSSKERLQMIDSLQLKIQQRKMNLPRLINEAISSADAYFAQHQPQKHKSHLSKSAFTTDSLFNFFVTEKSRPELDHVYQQMTLAADIWNHTKHQKFPQSFESEFMNFYAFFQDTVNEIGPGRDLLNGLAYSYLFMQKTVP